MNKPPLITRRNALLGFAAVAVVRPVAATAKVISAAPPASKAAMVSAADFGLIPDVEADQSAALQKAADGAAARGLPLFLPGGTYRASNVNLTYSVTIYGVDGATIIISAGAAPIFHGDGQSNITLRSLSLDGTGGGPMDSRSGLVAFNKCERLRLDAIDVHQGPGNGLFLSGCSGLVTGSHFGGHADSGIFAIDSHELTISQNQVIDCGNGGILVWQSQPGRDGTIVSGNHIARISARAGGNGQNGNGINIFRADNVIVADNIIENCDFSAIRANTTRNASIRGNTCTNVSETGIYSEFAFSGSVIANNIVDGAAAGISITNLDQGGRLAVCSGNIVRNILPKSPTNPDSTPTGISAQADTAVTGNTVSNVPGVGINAGYGPYLRNVIIADNVISEIDTAIDVSVAPGAGPVRIAGNMISGARVNAIVGMQWEKLSSADLVADAAQFPNVSVEGNIVVGP